MLVNEGRKQTDGKRVKPNATCAADGWSSEASVPCRQQKHPESSWPPPCHCGQADAGETALSSIGAPDCAPQRCGCVYAHTLAQCQLIPSLLLSRWCPQRESWVGAACRCCTHQAVISTRSKCSLCEWSMAWCVLQMRWDHRLTQELSSYRLMKCSLGK